MGITKLVGGVAALAVLAAVAGGVWYFVIRDDAPEEVSLAGALSSLNGTSTPASGDATAAPTEAEGTTAPEATTTTAPDETTSVTSIDGTWTIDTTQDSFVGYRVQEELARIGATTAVGRTSAVTGTAAIDNGQLQNVTVTADLTQLQSDSNMRDGQLRNQGIETSKFPSATFTLTDTQGIPDGLTDGQEVTTTVTGTLELHGVTRQISVPVQATVTNGYLVVVGSTTIEFADFDITAPSAASVLSIDDTAVMELQLFLKKG